jgi:2-polyprenyl-6-hydroxyphenyl methylase/3-demethylubiquinone-9 3-methyltransferase
MANTAPHAEVPAFGWQPGESSYVASYLHVAILEALNAEKAHLVLDAGCGNGHLCRVMEQSGYSVIGIDADLTGIATARADNPGLDIRHYSFSSDPAALLPGKLFDAVVCTEVVEHLYAPHELAQFASKALRPGGVLVISTPYHGWLKNLALALTNKFDHHWTPLWYGGHIKFWSRATLTQLLADAGLKVEGFIGAGRFPFLWKSMILIARKPYN